jgi:hypothetical protein
VTTFHDAFTRARDRIRGGADPEREVPAVLAVAEAQEEIEMAERLYGDLPDGEGGR